LEFSSHLLSPSFWIYVSLHCPFGTAYVLQQVGKFCLPTSRQSDQANVRNFLRVASFYCFYYKIHF
jgi:hypothetical protein